MAQCVKFCHPEVRAKLSTLDLFKACRHRTCVSLEARAPLGAGEHFVDVNVAGFEEGVGARLVPVQVEALDLRLVELQVEVGVQAREHPTEGVLANR